MTIRETAAKRQSDKADLQPDTKPSKLDLILAQLSRPDGATLDELMATTGWQKHSVRGALAGTLKRKGHATTSTKVDGVRRYCLEAVES